MKTQYKYDHKYTGICGYCKDNNCYDCLEWYPHLNGPKMPGYCQCVCNKNKKG